MKKMKFVFRFLTVTIFCFITNISNGKVILPALISDNMVLQQNSTVALWGWANPSEVVTVLTSWNNGTYKTTTNEQGIWMVKVRTTKAGGPYTIAFKASNYVEVGNVLLGEVWLASGQSNMEFVMEPVGTQKGVLNYQQEIDSADYPAIRMIDVRNTIADTPVIGISGKWEVCSPITAGKFSAVAYYFARKLYREKGIPVGIINSSYGGTPIESWMNKAVLESDTDFKPILEKYDSLCALYPEKHRIWLKQMDEWHREGKGKAPAAPIGPGSSISPCKLYNGMIAPLLNTTLAGIIWYQGEANVKDPELYKKLFPALIKSWRSDFRNRNLPFYFVQIAPHKGQTPFIREAQLNTYHHVANTGIVITTDVGDTDDIHPRDKKPVGERLAYWALSKKYGDENISYSSPIYKSMVVKGSKILISFDFGNGLYFKNANLNDFMIAGDDNKFVHANARIEGNKVEVWSDLVSVPKAVRYNWENVPAAQLFNGAGLPASPFRTDE